MTDFRDRIKELRRVRAGDLKPDERNWRRHPESQRQALIAMMERVGVVDAVIARETAEGLVLVDGHLRSDIAEDAEIPVLVVDLDEAEAGEVLATFDPLSAMANRDDEVLTALIQGVARDDEELQAILAEMHDNISVVPENPNDPDATVEPPTEAVSQRGDVWKLGEHRLMCGDSTDAADVAQLLAGQEIQAIVTDPPYSSGGFQESGRSRGSKGTEAEYIPITNDRLSTRGYLALLKQVLSHAPVLAVYIFTDWRMWINTFDIVEASSYAVRAMIVWDKGTAGMGSGWRTQHELILCGTSRNGLWEPKWPGQGNVIPMGRTGNLNHPTEKPVELIEQILANTPFAPTVYDPFVGSGTTIIAAERQGRACYAMEIEPRYVDACVKRWEDYTGEKAERA